jgi:hypothetical protein
MLYFTFLLFTQVAFLSLFFFGDANRPYGTSAQIL